jgi:hypothetical protein
MLKSKVEVFAPTDGIALVYRETDGRKAVGLDFSTTEGLQLAYKLPCKEMMLRALDVDRADTQGEELSAKLRTRTAPDLSTLDVVSYGGRLFEVSTVDHGSQTSFLYLSELVTDGTCELVSYSATTDAHHVKRKVEQPPVTVYVRRSRLGSNAVFSASAAYERPTTSLRIRACDYAHQEELRRDGITYAIRNTSTHGEWIDLVCEQRGDSNV